MLLRVQGLGLQECRVQGIFQGLVIGQWESWFVFMLYNVEGSTCRIQNCLKLNHKSHYRKQISHFIALRSVAKFHNMNWISLYSRLYYVNKEVQLLYVFDFCSIFFFSIVLLQKKKNQNISSLFYLSFFIQFFLPFYLCYSTYKYFLKFRCKAIIITLHLIAR